MATTYNISVLNGDTYAGCNFTITVNSAALNLTGAAIKMQVRKQREEAVVLELSTGSGITITTAAEGKFKINEQVISCAVGVYLYDIQITLSGGNIKTYIKGTFTVLGDITYG